MDMESDASFKKDRHLMFLVMMYDLLPSEYQSQEINTLTLAYFTLSSLDILGALEHAEEIVCGTYGIKALDHRFTEKRELVINKEEIASWVLSFQVHPPKDSEMQDGQFYGFHGSRSSQFPLADSAVANYNNSHLASTYCALAILKIVNYDLSQIDSESIAISMKNLQRLDGSFMPIHIGAESDLRFVYCAASISYMLGNWSGIDKEKAKQYIFNCQSYDGGFGLCPGLESHGGATYCAIASLRLMGYINDNVVHDDELHSVINVPLLLDWITQRQAFDGGFQGRSNKPSDTCYAFWIGGVLKILGCYEFVDGKAVGRSLMKCQSKYGGFSKFPRELPELYHSYYGFSALSLLEEPSLNPLSVELGITQRSARGA